MIRLFASAAIALAPLSAPALAQQTCEPEARVVLDRTQPNEELSELQNNNIGGAVVSRFRNVPTTTCYPQEQVTVTPMTLAQMAEEEEQQ